ncbi:MAG TPA: hypothetical protein VGF19_14230 [Candidatus Acidoferrum sp.]|jgi:hypothetical protein
MSQVAQTEKSSKVIRLLQEMLRISFRVVMFVVWVTFAGAAFGQTPEKRVVKIYAVDRAAAENLQRWVDAGHDTWCRHAELVAARTLREIAPEMDDELTLASSSLESEEKGDTQATYIYRSLDGGTSYRIAVRRYEWLKSETGNTDVVWIPERVEMVTDPTRD